MTTIASFIISSPSSIDITPSEIKSSVAKWCSFYQSKS